MDSTLPAGIQTFTLHALRRRPTVRGRFPHMAAKKYFTQRKTSCTIGCN
jgi:hypothetical protein